MTKKMVDEQAPSTDICRGQKLVVTVEEAQVDLLLVSYEHGTQVFQGVLLDSTKGRLPCGIHPPGGQFPPEPPKTPTTLENEDKLFSVKQRHTYYQQDPVSADGTVGSKEKKGVQLRRSISLTQRFKNSRMTVRLRPRQVLCSKCQSICNEKSENVSGAKGQRATEPPTTSKVTAETRGSTRGSRDRGSQESHGTLSAAQKREREKEKDKSPQKSVMLVPKLVKLKPSEIEAATSKGVSCLRISPPARNSRSDSDSCDSEISVGSNPAYAVSGNNNNNTDGKVPKLKLSTNLTEGKRKGRIPKMTINLALQASELSKENWTRNRLDDTEDDSEAKSPCIPKMILSTSGVVSDQASDRREKDNNKARKQGDSSESRLDAKELRLRSGNVHKLTINTAGHQSFSESLSDRVSPIPKLTILPVLQKKEGLEEQEAGDVKHHKKASEDSPLEKMSLRKKRSLGSMEDLWDESVFDETAKKHKSKEEEENEQEETSKMGSEEKEGIEGDKPKATPVLKISFGPEGKGTVLKIPSKSTVVTMNTPEVETEEEINKKYKDMSAKAAKKALKKAKKEAQKKALLGGASPAYIMGGMSPRFGGMSPLRLGGMSPARLGGFSPARFGGTSPARFGGMSPARAAAVDLSTRDLPPKKHKHKVKHKKKHKDERRHKSPEDNKSQSKDIKDDLPLLPDTAEHDVPVENITPDIHWNSSEMRESHLESLPHAALNQISHGSQPASNSGAPIQSSRHKLSISIKRVSNASYVACDSSHSDGERTVTPTIPSGNEDDIIEEAQGVVYSEQESKDEGPKDVCESVECEKDVPLEVPVPFDGENNRTVKTTEENAQSNPLLTAPTYCVDTPESMMPGSDSPGSDEACSGAIPDFPSRAPNMDGLEDHPSAALLMKLSWQEVEKCELEEGRIMNVGDVVWGKIHGFPWWPAKVKAIRELREGGGDTKWQQAHVSWYGSSTSSLMPANTLQPFLQMFKIRHNKRKRGPYREAIKQATCEAEQMSSLDPQQDFQPWHPPQHLLSSNLQYRRNP
ncbi:uncharacterized protein LOC122265886 [Penaeus japonicus]|uniref:uncharacterized protein LOC122265886 n=1 Tax=Penaeus japonicus TaxID=27405 RepID=UPI001C71006D|nr:uncharacterized protein LOC122265886 [Penaeus japonicus]